MGILVQFVLHAVGKCSPGGHIEIVKFILIMVRHKELELGLDDVARESGVEQRGREDGRREVE